MHPEVSIPCRSNWRVDKQLPTLEFDHGHANGGHNIDASECLFLLKAPNGPRLYLQMTACSSDVPCKQDGRSPDGRASKGGPGCHWQSLGKYTRGQLAATHEYSSVCMAGKASSQA